MYLSTPQPQPVGAAAVRPSATGRATEIEFAWRVLEEIDYGLILVSAAGHLQHANHLARRELTLGRFLRLEGAIVTGVTDPQAEELQQGMLGAAVGRRQMVTLHNDRDSLPIACVPLFPPFEGESAAVLLMLGRQSGAQNLAASFFARTHGLTRAEESVLKSLCDGLEVHEIATANGVSEYTVRTQVRSLRDKTGINSMRLLVQRVAALPPVAPNEAGHRPFTDF
jgi:DNA-binding CsgD family transcriptional regulator